MKESGLLHGLNMASEKYLTSQQASRVFLIRHKLTPFDSQPLSKMGLEWVYQRDQYQIVNEKLWCLTRLKYGI